MATDSNGKVEEQLEQRDGFSTEGIRVSSAGRSSTGSLGSEEVGDGDLDEEGMMVDKALRLRSQSTIN
jgi:hypothetical protein